MSSDRCENLEEFHDYHEHEEQECLRSAPQNAYHHDEELDCLRCAPQNACHHDEELECLRSAPQNAYHHDEELDCLRCAPQNAYHHDEECLVLLHRTLYRSLSWVRTLKTSRNTTTRYWSVYDLLHRTLYRNLFKVRTWKTSTITTTRNWNVNKLMGSLLMEQDTTVGTSTNCSAVCGSLRTMREQRDGDQPPKDFQELFHNLRHKNIQNMHNGHDGELLHSALLAGSKYSVAVQKAALCTCRCTGCLRCPWATVRTMPSITAVMKGSQLHGLCVARASATSADVAPASALRQRCRCGQPSGPPTGVRPVRAHQNLSNPPWQEVSLECVCVGVGGEEEELGGRGRGGEREEGGREGGKGADTKKKVSSFEFLVSVKTKN